MTQVTAPCKPFLDQDARHVRRDAEAEIDGVAVAQLLAARRAITFSEPHGASSKLTRRRGTRR